MLIPSPYDGYNPFGRRTYNVGGGVGEAMLLGAITGAGTSAITGGDPLKGAMFGALGGGVTSGLGGALGGGASGATAGTTAGTAAGTTAGTAAATGAVESAAASALPGSMGAEQAAAYFGGPGGSFANIAPPTLPGMGAEQAASYFGGPNQTFANIAPPQQDASGIAKFIKDNPIKSAVYGGGITNTLFNRPEYEMPGEKKYDGPLSRFVFDPSRYQPYTPTPPNPPYIPRYADGGIAGTEKGMYPQSQFPKTQYAVPSQMPTSAEVIEAGYEPRVNPYTGEMQYRSGGIADLGSYSDGGRLLKGPGDGMSDSIPARIGRKQPARLADGEFVVPADVVSGIGNGSTDAGAKQLYAMMDKVRKARTGTKKQGKAINPRRYMPA
jgi:hypothetical protein